MRISFDVAISCIQVELKHQMSRKASIRSRSIQFATFVYSVTVQLSGDLLAWFFPGSTHVAVVAGLRAIHCPGHLPKIYVFSTPRGKFRAVRCSVFQ